jgi:hypothetical protein
MIGDPYICCYCNERQDREVVFDAIFPLSKVKYTVEYCKHLDVMLNDDIKFTVNKLGCPYPQKVRNEMLYGR